MKPWKSCNESGPIIPRTCTQCSRHKYRSTLFPPILTRITKAAVPRMICNYSSTTCTPMHPMPTVTVSRHTFPQSGSLTAFTRARPLRLAQPPCRLDLLPAGGSTPAVSGMPSLHTSPILMNHYLCDSAAETAVAVSAKNIS